MAEFKEKELVKCSFCGKSETEVERMLHSPLANICDACVELCYDLLAEEGVFPKRELKEFYDQNVLADASKLLKPQEIKAVLSRRSSSFRERAVGASAQRKPSKSPRSGRGETK